MRDLHAGVLTDEVGKRPKKGLGRYPLDERPRIGDREAIARCSFDIREVLGIVAVGDDAVAALGPAGRTGLKRGQHGLMDGHHGVGGTQREPFKGAVQSTVQGCCVPFKGVIAPQIAEVEDERQTALTLDESGSQVRGGGRRGREEHLRAVGADRCGASAHGEG